MNGRLVAAVFFVGTLCDHLLCQPVDFPQALLEMQDLAAAINMIQFYTGVQANVK